jgi:vitamin K-dependent gamma-carboxylase
MSAAQHNTALPAPDDSRKTAWSQRLFQPVPIDWLVFYRIAFGIVMAWYAAKNRDEIDYFYVDPAFHFSYTGFGWVQPWMAQFGALHGMHIVFMAMLVCAIFIAIGLWYRLAATGFFLLFTYVFLCDKCYYQNHYYLVCILSALMPFLPANRALSIDALLHPEIRTAFVPRWTLWLVRFQIGVPYFFGGIAKIDRDWLRGQPMRMNLASRADQWPFNSLLSGETGVQLFVWGGLLFDLLIVPALLWKRTRPIAFVLCIIFHVTNANTFTIGIFPWLMILATTVYFEPHWPTRLLARLTHTRLRPVRPTAWTCPSHRARKLTAGVLAAFIAVQCLVPLRFLVIGGNPNWDEHCHFFSWHMMLRAKQQAMAVYATDPATGRSGIIDVRDVVTDRQLVVISRDPDLILQLCHKLRDRLEAMGHPDLQLRVFSLVSLNGRKPQLMIDPTVDLAGEPLSWRYPSWVVPLHEPFRHDAWNVPLPRWKDAVDVDLPPQMQLAQSPPAPAEAAELTRP